MVFNHTVQNRVQHDQHTHGFQLTAEVKNIEQHNAVAHIHIGLIGEYIQCTIHEQFQCQRDGLGLRLRLAQQFLTEVFQRRRIAVVLDVLAVHIAHAPPDDRTLFRAHRLRLHQLLAQGHDKLAFQNQRVVRFTFLLAVTASHVHRVDVVRAAC